MTQVAVVGCGYWGRNIVRNLAELGALAAVCDTDPATARQHADAHGVPARPLDEVLDDPAVGAVAVAAPAAEHFDITARVLHSGRAAFVEKPLSLKTADAAQLCELADEAGQVLMVGHVLQYHPAFLALRELVRAGELGRVQYLYSNRLNLGKIRREEDILWSFAPHDLSMILSLVGTEPDGVSAVGARYLHKSIADVTTTHLSFPGGEQAHVFVSWLHPFKEQKLVVVGDRAMAVFDDLEDWDAKLHLYRHRVDWREGMPQPVKAEAEPVALEPAEPLRRELEHFLACVETRERPVTDGWEGLRVLSVLEQAAEHLGTGSGPHAEAQASATGRPWAPGVFVHESTYVDDDVEIGEGTRVWHFCHLLSGARVGRDCTVGQNVMVGADVVVGDGCKVQNNVSLYTGVRLGRGVFCGPSCVFTNVSTPRAGVERKDEFAPTPVGDGATIGANATVVCGHELGHHCFVAAGAVVTRDVAPHALVAGVPARRVGWVSHDGEVLGDDLVCPRSGRRYEVVEGELRERTG